MAKKPTYGPAKLPLFSAAGLPMHLDDTGTPSCNCCDTLIDCESVVACLKRRMALLDLNLIPAPEEEVPPGHNPLECLSEGNGSYLYEPYKIDMICDEGFGVYAWQNPDNRPPSVFDCLFQFDPAFCPIYPCGASIGAYCEDGLVYVIWGIRYILCPGCGSPDNADFYFPCEGDGCGCSEHPTQIIMKSDGMDWEDLKALLLTDSVIEFTISHAPLWSSYPGRIPKLDIASDGTVKFFAPPPCDGVCEGNPPAIILFEAEQIVGCRYKVTYELAEGDNDPDCPLRLAYLWYEDEEDQEQSFIIEVPVEPIGTNWPNVMEINFGYGCGTRGGGSDTVKLKVWDKCGCTAEDTEEFGCCACEDANGGACPEGCVEGCPTGDGNIVATQPACSEVLVTVTQPTCGVYVFSEGDADEQDGGGPDPGGCGCIDPEEWEACLNSLGMWTSSHTFDLCGTQKYMAALGESPCGCFGPWFDLGEFVCDTCGCCTGCLHGMRMSISGFGDGVCNCSIANVEDIERPMATGGEFGCFSDSDPIVFHVTLCEGDGEATDLSIDLNWNLICLPDEEEVQQYYLRVGFDLTHTSGSPALENSGDYDIYLGTEKPACTAVSGCHTFYYPGFPTTLCTELVLEVCAEAY